MLRRTRCSSGVKKATSHAGQRSQGVEIEVSDLTSQRSVVTSQRSHRALTFKVSGSHSFPAFQWGDNHYSPEISPAELTVNKIADRLLSLTYIIASPAQSPYRCTVTLAKMITARLARNAQRSLALRLPLQTPAPLSSIKHIRSISSSTKLRAEDKPSGANGEHEGTFARTSKTIKLEYPGEHDLPKSTPVQGRGGMHFKRTLASFSLEGRVGVVTGGARGLGLVMSQALVVSGADVALVDLNREFRSNIEQLST
jgi:hypothetical protein